MAYPGPVFPDNRKRGQDYPYTKKTAVQWGGYNHRKAAGDMEWYDDMNMTADYAPLLATRQPFYTFHNSTDGKYHGMVGGDKLYVAAGTKIYQKQMVYEAWNMVEVATATDTDKLMCVFGPRLLVWPDKKSITVHDDGTPTDIENLEATANATVTDYTAESDVVNVYRITYTPVQDQPSVTYDCIVLPNTNSSAFTTGALVETDGFSNHKNNTRLYVRAIEHYSDYTYLYFDADSLDVGTAQYEVYDPMTGTTVQTTGYAEIGTHSISLLRTAKIFSGTIGGEAATANCIQIPGNVTSLREGDAVQIKGAYPHGENDISIIIREISHQKSGSDDYTTFHFYDNSFDIGNGTTTIIDDTGEEKTVNGYTVTGDLKLKRSVPDLDILFVHENRLWGAKGDTIYASALGDPFNWNVFDGLGTDSWTVDVMDEGNITGGCSFLGYAVFFKDNHIYKVYGNVPSDFQLVQSADLGVENGSGKSLAIAGEKLYYLSRAGIMCYSGGLPQLISQPFGDIRYHNGIAGTDGLRYWITLEQANGIRTMFVYDTQTGVWHRELYLPNVASEAVFDGYAWHSNGLYCAIKTYTESGGVQQDATALMFIGESEFAPGAQAENPIQWYVESADFTEYSPQRKWIGPRIEIRAELGIGASFTVKVKHNNVDDWLTIGGPFTNTGQTGIKKSFVCSKIPARADFYKVRIEGQGRVWIYSIAPMTEQGSSDFGYNGG